MKNKIIICILIINAFLLSMPVNALPWGKERLAPIQPQPKVDYVNINWWENFSDPYLKYYIIQAIQNNHSVKEASWKVEEYKYNVKLQFSRELPSLSVGGSYVLNHFPDDVKLGVKDNIFAVPFIMNYEADIFLKNHDKTKSSKKAYQASKEQEQSVYISLASDVATTYINIVKYDKQIQIQKDIVKNQAEQLKRAETKFNRGTISVPELNEYKKNYENAKSSQDEFIKSRDKALNQLAILIGESAENSCNLKRNSFDKLEYKNKIPECISSDVVFSRPDILAAETNLEKANIDVRVARKEFLPSLNITGFFAFTNAVGNFGSFNNAIAAAVAGLTQDLFKGGYKVANLKVYKTRYEQMFEAYQQTDLTALKEVNDSLLIVREDTKIDTNTIKNLKTQKDTYNRAKESYRQGIISYPELLTQENSYLNIGQTQTNTKATRLVDYITLYKSVGGKL